MNLNRISESSRSVKIIQTGEQLNIFDEHFDKSGRAERTVIEDYRAVIFARNSVYTITQLCETHHLHIRNFCSHPPTRFLLFF